MPPQQADSPVTNQAIEDLALCLTEAADQIGVLRDAIDELRDDFRWALDNLRPVEFPQHVIVKRMAADPTADDWNERLQLVHPDRRETAEVVAELCEELIERVGTIISQIATEQLEMILVSLNELRDHLIAATDDRATFRQPPADSFTMASPEAIPAESEEEIEKQKPAQPLHIRLFFQDHMTELVRLFGYDGLPLAEAREQLKPLVEKYGETAIRAATDEIVEVDSSTTPETVQLTGYVRQLAIQILGRPPEARPQKAAEASDAAAVQTPDDSPTSQAESDQDDAVSSRHV